MCSELTRSEPVRKNVFIIDDHAIVRRGLRDLFSSEPDFSVCGEAATAADARVKLREIPTDLVLCDLMLDGRSCLDLTRELAGERRRRRILIVSMHDEPLYVHRCLEAGACGYISKQRPTTELIKAARDVLNGEVYVSECKECGPEEPVLDRLTDREFEVFLLLGQGFVPRHIADQLNLSVSTVEVYRQRLKEKLHVASSPMLLRYAVRWCRDHSAP